MLRTTFLLTTVIATLLAPSGARAHWVPGDLFDDDFLLIGLEGGYVVDLDPEEEQFAVGAEVSWVRMRNLRWAGALVQARVLGPSPRAFFAIGAEGGAGPLGADLSLIVGIGKESYVGGRLRGCLTFGVLGMCGGGSLTTAGPQLEVTGALKWPIWWTPRFLRSSE